MQSSSWTILVGLIPLLLLVAPIATGIVLIVVSRRGRQSHAACGGCGYDVTGSVGQTDRCPECGAPFTSVGIDAPRTARRPVMMGFGIALLVIGLTCGTSLVGMLVFSTTTSPARPVPAPRIQTSPPTADAAAPAAPAEPTRPADPQSR
ncbi:MAG: hypothetical protein ACYTJ0_11130 [Planctomycetota bacterium]|jgi:hypothetical protein